MEHHYDAKLEALRSDLRQKEQELLAGLQQRDKEMEALRSPAIQNTFARRNILVQKEIEAYDMIWDTINKAAPLKMSATFMQTINIEKLKEIKHIGDNEREFFENICKLTSMEKMSPTESRHARPYISNKCWAKFSAYMAIGSYAATILIMLRSGIAISDLLKEDELRKLVSVALPNYTNFLDEHGTGALFYLMDVLEEDVFAEIQIGLRGDRGVSDLAETQEIINAARELSSTADRFKVEAAANTP